MARVVVTGATGFVGANLARRLLDEGHQVHLLVRPDHAGWRIESIRQRLSLHRVNLARAQDVHAAIARIAPEWVFHLAVYGAYPTQTDVATMVETNVLGTANLIQASIQSGVEAIVNTGSSSEYGFKASAPTESEAAEPNSAYAITKLAATQLCRELARRSGARLRTLRLYSVYGPFEEPTRLIPTLIVRALDNELPPLADPRTSRDFVFVDDVVDAYLLAAQRPHPEPGAIFNVGSGIQTSLSALVATVRQILSIQAQPEWGAYPDRTWDTHTWVSNSTRIQRELGWVPRYTLEAGLRQTIAWFQQEPACMHHYRHALGRA